MEMAKTLFSQEKSILKVKTVVSQENLILFDWLTFTSHSDSPETVMQLLGLKDVPWQKMDILPQECGAKGVHGFDIRPINTEQLRLQMTVGRVFGNAAV